MNVSYPYIHYIYFLQVTRIRTAAVVVDTQRNNQFFLFILHYFFMLALHILIETCWFRIRGVNVMFFDWLVVFEMKTFSIGPNIDGGVFILAPHICRCAGL